MADSGFRQILILMALPRWPKYKTTSELVDYLDTQGIKASKRTVQRDIQILSSSWSFNIIDTPATGRGKEGVGWAFGSDVASQGIPSMDPSAALTFLMGYEHLKTLLPKQVLCHIEPYREEAKNILETFNQANFSSWIDKIRIIPNAILAPAAVDQDAINLIYQALLSNLQFTCTYNGKEGQVISPYGIIQRANTLYLLCKFFGYEDIRITALQRFAEIEILDKKIRKGNSFLIDDYLSSGAMLCPINYEAGHKTIKLKAKIDEDLQFHLNEMPLANDQTITKKSLEGWHSLSATVLDSHELRYWLLSQGDKIEVTAPKAIRSWVRDTISNMSDIYGVK